MSALSEVVLNPLESLRRWPKRVRPPRRASELATAPRGKDWFGVHISNALPRSAYLPCPLYTPVFASAMRVRGRNFRLVTLARAHPAFPVLHATNLLPDRLKPVWRPGPETWDDSNVAFRRRKIPTREPSTKRGGDDSPPRFVLSSSAKKIDLGAANRGS